MTAPRPDARPGEPGGTAAAAVGPTVGRSGRGLWLTALGVCLLVAGLLARFASDQPDGLERVAEDQGIAEHAIESTGLLDSAHASSALLGLGIVLLLTTGLSWALRRREPPAHGR